MGWLRRNFVKMFDAGKTRIIGLLYGEKKLWQYVKPFSSNTGTSRTDGRMDRIAISISRVSVLTRDKNAERRRTAFAIGVQFIGIKQLELHYLKPEGTVFYYYA